MRPKFLRLLGSSEERSKRFISCDPGGASVFVLDLVTGVKFARGKKYATTDETQRHLFGLREYRCTACAECTCRLFFFFIIFSPSSFSRATTKYTLYTMTQNPFIRYEAVRTYSVIVDFFSQSTSMRPVLFRRSVCVCACMYVCVFVSYVRFTIIIIVITIIIISIVHSHLLTPNAISRIFSHEVVRVTPFFR